jgi:hypothetical protein
MIMLGDAGILAPAAGKADQAPDREGEKGAPAPETGSGGASVVEVEQEPVAPKPQPDVLRGRILLKPPYMIGVSVARRPASGWRRAVWLAVPLILAGALAAFGGRDLIGFAGDAAGRIANGVQHVIKSFKAQEHKNGH